MVDCGVVERFAVFFTRDCDSRRKFRETSWPSVGVSLHFFGRHDDDDDADRRFSTDAKCRHPLADIW
jgi:hypothetical protein